MMNLQVFLLVFVVVIATHIHCQAQLQQDDSAKSPEVKGHDVSKQQVKTCHCTGRRNVVEQNCPCELLRNKKLIKDQRDPCLKKKSKKCQQFNGGNRKEKGFSMPI